MEDEKVETINGIFSFALWKDQATDGYVGELVDEHGWTIRIRASVGERNGKKAFIGRGDLTNIVKRKVG